MRELTVDGEAMSAVEGQCPDGVIVNLLDMQVGPQRAAFDSYQAAFRANEREPNLAHAAELVRAWNVLADVTGLART
ncbi:hypothetical protein GCM10007989_05170 [Devosia pacifica]|uniref:Uncharacterized protein n=1 Tax=Devosia pacifica TaxID=1335967 RepID=A0A918VPU1_9HYPH|nr:hypothetical protein [Devosia pacifica]GHA13537.1 hypothetical protein GCM10007989_05170 [Devosia pacifica]